MTVREAMVAVTVLACPGAVMCLTAPASGDADKTLGICEHLGELDSPPESPSMEMVGIGQTFETK